MALLFIRWTEQTIALPPQVPNLLLLKPNLWLLSLFHYKQQMPRYAFLMTAMHLLEGRNKGEFLKRQGKRRKRKSLSFSKNRTIDHWIMRRLINRRATSAAQAHNKA